MVKQLIATNATTGMTIIQRYLDGVRYLKVTPRNLMPVIIQNLKTQFGDKLEVVESETGWIKMVKVEGIEDNEKLGELTQKIVKPDDEVNEDYILNKEATMLRQQGFQVEIKEIK